MRDFAYADRQAFLHPPRLCWIDTVVGYVVTALLGAVFAVALIGGRYAG